MSERTSGVSPVIFCLSLIAPFYWKEANWQINVTECTSSLPGTTGTTGTPGTPDAPGTPRQPFKQKHYLHKGDHTSSPCALGRVENSKNEI